jgi:hypothetical protein
MGKCYPIIRFLDCCGISHLYSQPNRLMKRAIKKLSHGSHQSPQSHFAVPTMEGMALGPSPVRNLTSLAAHRADAPKNTLAPPLPRARNKVPGGSPVCLRSKPECGFVSRGSCSRVHLRSRIQMVTRGEAQHGPHPLERGAAAPHGMRLGRPPRGLKRKPESLRKQEGNKNVITLSRFLWLEQWRGRQPCRPQPPSPWEQWILRKKAFWAGACTHGFWFAALRPSNVETPGRGQDARATSGGSACTSTSRTPSELTRHAANVLPAPLVRAYRAHRSKKRPPGERDHARTEQTRYD